MVIADNNSSDESLTVLQRIVAKDPQVIGIANSSNYGPEASAVNAFRHAGDCSLMICLCSDLQDPPEQSVEMVVRLLQDNSKDAVLAVKSRSAGGPLLQMARRTYYKALGYSSRLQQVPSGFHGFGCYRSEVVEEILRYWDESGMNLRMCIANSCHSPVLIHYRSIEPGGHPPIAAQAMPWRPSVHCCPQTQPPVGWPSPSAGLAFYLPSWWPCSCSPTIYPGTVSTKAASPRSWPWF